MDLQPDMTEHDRELVTWAREGRSGAFDALVERFGPSLLAYLNRLLPQREDAMDAFQDTFLSAHRGLTDLQDASRFRAWLWTIAANAVRIHLRRRHASPQRTSLEIEPAAAADATVGLDGLCRQERRTAVRTAMAQLPDRQRNVLALRLDGGLDYKAIATALQISEESARANHYQALRTMRKLLEPVLDLNMTPGTLP